ncbi:ralBP1-associated Eps domain-containing protein 1-like [Amphibalanus amphitrite]|uniref:ralBP1-associated Eps domain-containing protein 1-like n=1 Tax=Amphibalanus amphitrite TaxID=1232801 RepID=UPI001C928EC1|nr:ralBP1-associated Eps domain-containing protein 1-like [Amphibalanus amphitrite]
MNLIKSPDLINLNDTDTDAEIQYKSLDATNGDATADTDEPRLSGDSPSASSPASDSPKPSRQGHVHWRTAHSDEHRQLLATEGESSDRHSSEDEEDEVDVWTVTAEQRQYYVQQFVTLQPDTTALLPGHTAKAFFEKSKLPVTALSKIWNLSDVTRDGCLCLEEFVTAMHLVVLRRNRIEVPDQLPPQLVPKPAAPAAAPPPPVATAAPGQLTSPKGKEWTKFVESPMSNISSPGIKPVNFDFHKSAVEQNPQILHPVAVKGTREEHPAGRPTADSDSELSDGRPTARKALRHCSSGPHALGDSASSGPTSLPVLAQTAPTLPSRLAQPAPPPPPPRPGHTGHARSSSLDLSCVPPVVPPRSSPADSQRPAPATADPSAGFADFSQFEEPSAPDISRVRQGAFEVYKKPAAAAAAAAAGATGGASPAGSRHGSGGDHAPSATEPRPSRPAPHPHLESPVISPGRLAKMTPQELMAVSSWSRESLLLVLRAQRERTATLAAVTAELNQELAETVEERTSLELQLDHMRPDND